MNPSTLVGGRFFSGFFSLEWQTSGASLIDLPGRLPPVDDKVRLARWWYLKSIEAPLAIDQFLALWAAVEVLRPLDWEGISAPLTLRCGHGLSECPTCGSGVERNVNGPTMKKYVEGLGMLESESKKLWDIRQVVHGANRFTSSHVQALGSLLVKFRPMVLAPMACVLVGDSLTYIQAAKAAATPVIGYANKPGKAELFAELNPQAIVAQIVSISSAVRSC